MGEFRAAFFNGGKRVQTLRELRRPSADGRDKPGHDDGVYFTPR
jgi:hypothetical protein